MFDLLSSYKGQKPPFGVFQIDPSSPLASGLVVAVPCVELNAQVIDYVNMRKATMTASPTWSPSSIGPMVTFNGTSQGVDLGTESNARVTSKITICAAISHTGTAANRSILGWNAAVGGTPQLRLDTTHHLDFLSASVVDMGSDTTVIATNTLTHVGVVYDTAASPQVKFYVNGAPTGTQAGSGATFTYSASDTMTIGRIAAEWFAGSIAYAYVWNRPLTAQEMRAVAGNMSVLFRSKRFQRWLSVASTTAAARAETNRSQVGLEATAVASKIGAGIARSSAGFGATCTAVKIMAATALAKVGLRAAEIGAKVMTATAQVSVGAETISVGKKIGLGIAQAQIGIDTVSMALKIGLGTAQAEAGLEAESTSVHVAASVNATGQASAGVEATANGSKIVTGVAQASVGAEATASGSKLTTGTAWASTGQEAVANASKHGAAQAVVSVGASGQCSSGLRTAIGTARASAGLRARVLSARPSTGGGAGRQVIFVDGRLAVRLSPQIYERL